MAAFPVANVHAFVPEIRMPWPLNFVPPAHWGIGLNGRIPGDWTYAQWMIDDWASTLGAHYWAMQARADKPRRLPIVIHLPNGQDWCPDQMARNDAGFHGRGWQVDLDAGVDMMTITPSINCVGSYHGWVRAGYVTDDCEGRTFPRAPTRVPATPPPGRIDTPPPGDLTPNKPFRVMTDAEAQAIEQKRQEKALNDALARQLAGLPPEVS